MTTLSTSDNLSGNLYLCSLSVTYKESCRVVSKIHTLHKGICNKLTCVIPYIVALKKGTTYNLIHKLLISPYLRLICRLLGCYLVSSTLAGIKHENR